MQERGLPKVFLHLKVYQFVSALSTEYFRKWCEPRETVYDTPGLGLTGY